MRSKNLVYVSYIDKPSKIDLVYYNLNILQKYFDKIVLVYSTYNDKPITKECLNLEDDQLILHPNEGYDFEKYKIGIKKFLDIPTIYTVIMNDSVSISSDLYNVFHSINNYFSEGYEYLGFVENQEIKTHFQSWFLVFSSKSLKYFHDNIKEILSNKQDVIDVYEVNLSSKMIKEFKSVSLFQFQRNPFYSQRMIDDLNRSNKLYFIKNNCFLEKFKQSPHNMKLEKTMSYLSPDISQSLTFYLNE